MTMIYTDPVAAAPAFAEAIARSQQVLLLTHVNPDGDAIGSLLGMYHALTAMGKQAFPLASSDLPSYTLELPGVEHVAVYRRGDPLPPHDLVFMVDTASLARVGAVYDDHGPALAAVPLLIVDHHVTNVGGGNANLIMPTMASCAELVFLLLKAMDAPIPVAATTALLMGITTDTQSFQTSSSGPSSLRAAADLMELGADQRGVVQSVYFGLPFETIQLMGLALAETQRDGALVWSRVTMAMMEQTGAEEESADDVMRQMQRVAGGRAYVLFKERADGTVKVSLRSVPGINVSAVAAKWGGGGHTQAAGATLPLDLAAAEHEVLGQLRDIVAG